MRLVSLLVQDYRSLTKAHLPLKDLTVLIGPNNEGKSNLLRALVTALRFVSQPEAFQGRTVRFRGPQDLYRWQDDFPISKQESTPKGVSKFQLEFELDDDEIARFKEETGSKLNGTLPIELALGKGEPAYRVVKKGPGGAALSAKSIEIGRFISKRLQFQYIPAVRTAESAVSVVQDLVRVELFALEKDGKYDAALKAIGKLQEPLLEKLAEGIQQTLVEFLPNVKKVRVEISQDRIRHAVRERCRIVIDDGCPTDLENKGDGVQSLAALSLMRHASERGARGRELILAIEEPESHLHPRAIHQLKRVITEISGRHQVIMTTHCPLFADRADIAANIVVTRNSAKPARSLDQIRETLGVRAADNLQHAELVLLVEGEDDRLALVPLLSEASQELRAALASHRLVLDTLSGGTNLAYKAGLIRDAMCSSHAWLDDDKAGRDGFQRAKADGLMTDADCNFALQMGQNETELEDLYDEKVYETALKTRYGVSLTSPKFKGKKKWSDRLHDVFLSQGKQWHEEEVKLVVARAVAASSATALHPKRRSSFDAMVNSLTEKLDTASTRSVAGHTEPTADGRKPPAIGATPVAGSTSASGAG